MGIYVFDIDGTISTSGQKVSSLINNTLLELAKQHQLIFASARPVRDMLPMLCQQLHSSIFIGCNGAMAWQGGKTLLSYTLPAGVVTRTLDQLNQLNIPYVIDGEWHFAFSNQYHPFFDYIRALSDHEVSEDEIISSGVTKILILNEQNKEIIEHSLKEYEVSIHTHRTENFYDITPKGNNKHKTLTDIIGDVKYTAFGNDQNDFIMLSHANVSIFVGHQEVFKDADYYTSIENIVPLIKELSQQES